MSYLDDIIGALAGRAGELGGTPSPATFASIGGTANSPTPMAPIMSDPGPSAPTNIIPPVAQTAPTPIAAASAPQVATPAPTKTQSDFTLPPVTMTPPPVANVPFARSMAPQVQQLPMLGDVLGAQVTRKQYPMLGAGLGGGLGVGLGDY